jgi:8-oxo-dGTP pyrophosphatase MutT (NUDIX family)
MKTFADSYLGQLRGLVGQRELIFPGMRALIKDDAGRILLVHRADTKRWGLPAGSIELDESIYECLVREVKEETGLDVLSAIPYALYTHPRYAFTYPNGDKIKNFILSFMVTGWSGTLLRSTDETLDARFFFPDHLPDTHEAYLETIEDSRRYSGTLILK